MTDTQQKEDAYGIFTDTITISAIPMTDEMKRELSPSQLQSAETIGGNIVSVTIKGNVNPHGLGRAIGSLLLAYIGRAAETLGQSKDTVALAVLPTILGAAMHYAQQNDTQVASGKLQ